MVMVAQHGIPRIGLCIKTIRGIAREVIMPYKKGNQRKWRCCWCGNNFKHCDEATVDRHEQKEHDSLYQKARPIKGLRPLSPGEKYEIREWN